VQGGSTIHGGGGTNTIIAANGENHLFGDSGNDTFTVENPSVAVLAANRAFTIDGGGQTGDNLVIESGGGRDYAETYSVGPDSGSGTLLTSNGTLSQQIVFTGLAPIQDTAAAGSLTVNATVAGNAIRITDGGTANGFTATEVAVDSFEPIFFANKAAVTVNALDGDDMVTLNNPTAAVGLQSLTVDAGSGSDQVNVLATAAGVNTEITNSTGVKADLDTVTVGEAGSVQGIEGPLTVTNLSGLTDLSVFDNADTAARTITLSAQGLFGLAPASINFVGGDLRSLAVSGGSAGNTFNVTGTPTNQFGTLTTTLNTGAGTDAVNVQTTEGPLVVNGNAGRDTVVLGSLAPNLGGTLASLSGAVTVTNSGSSTSLTLDDSGSSSPKQVTVTDGGITGLAPTPIDFVAAELSPLTVDAGSGSDTFDVSGFTHAATIDGGTGGTNLVTVTKDVPLFTLADKELKTSDNMDVHLAHFGVAELTGGTSANTFDVSGWTGTGTLESEGGTDTVAARKDGKFALTDSRLLTSDGMSLALQHLSVANLTGGPSNNLFDVGGWTGSGSIDGGGGPNKVVATRDTDFNLSDTALSDSAGMALSLAHIQSAALTGGDGPNQFVVSNWTGNAVLDGRGDPDTYVVNLRGSGSGTTTVNDTGTGGTDRLIVNGTPAGDTIDVTETQITRAAETVNYKGVEQVAVNGGTGTNAITVSVTPTSGYDLYVDAGPSANDTLAINDVVGGAVLHNHPASDTSGMADIRYLQGLVSHINFVGAGHLILNPDADHSFVQALYHDLMGRPGTPAEIEHWVTVLHHKHQRTVDKWRKVVLKLEGKTETRQHTVEGWYQHFVGQPAVGKQLNRPTALLRDHTEEEVMATILGSRGFLVHAGGTKTAFLQALVQDLLSRPATAKELRQLRGLLATSSRQDVAMHMLLSREYRADEFAAIYRLVYRAYYGQGFGPGAVEIVHHLARHLDQRTQREILEAGYGFYSNG
jgi:hypothetical protein